MRTTHESWTRCRGRATNSIAPSFVHTRHARVKKNSTDTWRTYVMRKHIQDGPVLVPLSSGRRDFGGSLSFLLFFSRISRRRARLTLRRAAIQLRPTTVFSSENSVRSLLGAFAKRCLNKFLSLAFCSFSFIVFFLSFRRVTGDLFLSVIVRPPLKELNGVRETRALVCAVYFSPLYSIVR